MNSAQLDYNLRRDSCTQTMWRGVFPVDKIKLLPQNKLLPAGYIVNTAPSSHDGKHWVAFYFSENHAEFFDSYGFEPKKPEMTKFLKSYGHSDETIKKTNVRLQGNWTTVCGQYCVFFLTLRSRGWSYDEIMKTFSEKDYEWNDGLVQSFVNKHFNLNTDVINYRFVLQSVTSLDRS